MARPSGAAITVVTITRGRIAQLARALRTVADQTVARTMTVDHLVVIDDCPTTLAFLQGQPDGPVRWAHTHRPAGTVTGAANAGRLRNIGVELTRSRWVAFLDDDNLWTPDHLERLVTCATTTGCRAVHSHRDLRHPDGSPYLEEAFPWAEAGDAAREHEEAVTLGLMQCGSSVLRSTTQASVPASWRFVDMGEWLVRRDLLAEVPIPEDASDRVGEDDLWLDELLRRREPIATTGAATLIYVLGGMSNRPSDRP